MTEKERTEKGDAVDINASLLIRNNKVVAEIEKRLADIGYRNRIRLARISETGLAKLLMIIKDDEVDFKTKLDAIKDTLDRVGLIKYRPGEERVKGSKGRATQVTRIIPIPRPFESQDIE
jgi:hypothetical protein